MKRLMVVMAVFGLFACSGSDGSNGGQSNAPECETHSDCGNEYCVTHRTLSCDSGRTLEYDCIPCDDPPCNPSAVCESGERCKPEGKCNQEYIDDQGDGCSLEGRKAAQCVPCYADDQCSGEQVCHYNSCLR